MKVDKNGLPFREGLFYQFNSGSLYFLERIFSSQSEGRFIPVHQETLKQRGPDISLYLTDQFEVYNAMNSNKKASSLLDKEW